MTVDAAFVEGTAERIVRSLPLAHLSIELGHLYFEDFAEGPGRLRRHFAKVAPWVAAASAVYGRDVVGRNPRISTCFLIDDYFGPSSSPAQILPDLLEAAREAGLEIDYLARESACADVDGVALADLVRGRIVPDPPPGTNGARPSVDACGWLSNGQRSPGTNAAEAMTAEEPWRPPAQNAANRHSVFVDVQLWDQPGNRRRFSCAYLAAVWQLLRLGLLRNEGLPVAQPKLLPGSFPEEWERLPAVLQLSARPAPFSAYRTLSILHNRFFTTEHAVRTILSQVAVDPAVAAEVVVRARAEGLDPAVEPVNRIGYIFTD